VRHIKRVSPSDDRSVARRDLSQVADPESS
jgi:hypothetical protein